jgi:hypothetical protein
MDKKYIIILLIIYVFIIFGLSKLDFFDVIPPPKIMNKKIAIIFPYRDQLVQNRANHLKKTIDYYNNLNISDIDIYIIEQGNDKKFNRGILINAGHDIIKKSGINYINEVHHDIDVQPDKTLIKYFYSDKVIACKKAFYRHFFGTLSVLPINIMDQVNGYSNNFWGWGVEDDNLSRRITSKNITIYNADPKLTKLTELSHKTAWELNIVNPTRHEIDDKDKEEGYTSGLADLKYNIVKKQQINDRTFMITIDF